MERLTSRVRPVVVRPMTEEDVERVAAIESEAFTSPWQADTFYTLLQRPGVELHVLDDEGLVVGYSVVWCILDQGELSNIAVAPSHRGRGLAAQLLRHVMKLSKARGVESMYLEVRVSNTRAADLYRGFGFTEVGRRRNYYDRPREDAILMVML